MPTVQLQQPEHLIVTETVELGAPPSGSALVHVRRIGICGTDLHAYRGKQPFFRYPRVLGHELGVEVAAVAPGETAVAVGDRCAVEPYLYCGECSVCRRGKTNCCPQLQVLGVHIDGGMGEWLHVPVRNLHRSATLSLDQLALVEPLCIGAHAVHRSAVEPGETMLVVGAGPIGLAVMQAAKALGADVYAHDVNAGRLTFAREQFGVPAWDSANEAPTVVVDATGNPQSMHQAFSLPAHGGRLVFVGLFQGDVTFHDPDAHRRELTMLCSRNATRADFRHIIAQMESGGIDIGPWISHRTQLTAVPDEFAGWLDPAAHFIKAVVEV